MKHTSLLLICLIIHAICCQQNTPQDIAQKIKEYIHQTHRNDIKNKNLLQSWIRQASFPGNESGIQNIIAKTLKDDLKFDNVDVFDMSRLGDELFKNKLFRSPRTAEQLKVSPIVVGVMEPSDSCPSFVEINTDASQINQRYKSLILNGHVDVVPIGDETQWKHKDAFSGEYYHDGDSERIHGRGTTDMKGGIFSSLIAVQAIQHVFNTTRLCAKLIFQSVIEEESGGSGTLAAILRGYGTADAAIVPEPTGMKLFPRQQGSQWFRIHIYGKQAHGGTRYEGISAIEKSTTVIKSILSLEEFRNKPLRSDKMFSSLPIPVPINIGVIKGGEWPSSVCDHVVLEGRMGIIPDGKETIDSAKQMLEQWLSKDDLIQLDSYFEKVPVRVEWFGAAWVPGHVDTEHQVVQTLQRAYETATNGQQVTVASSPWATDAGYLNTVGGTPAVVIGPGQTSLAHQLDESISVDEIYKCGEVIALFISEWMMNLKK
ncbi:metallohydrolase yodQ [Acrasis kona]|uniref:Metallohydrolase yodQ n=1 Tax=Acrasis kona TaxID=1008807 RepID=A0AAW2Z9K5_9EUKA